MMWVRRAKLQGTEGGVVRTLTIDSESGDREAGVREEGVRLT